MAVPVGGTHPIQFYEGAGFREEFEVYEDDEITPLNFVSGSIGKSQMRTSEKTSAVLLAEFLVEVVDNKVIISLSSENSYIDNPPALLKNAYYDIFITEPGQEPIMFMEGLVKVNPAVTLSDTP